MMSAVAGGGGLVGRDEELETIRRLAADARVRGSSLVIRGAPGLGKSALLELVADELLDPAGSTSTPATRSPPGSALR